MKRLCLLCLLLLPTLNLAAQQTISGTIQVNGLERTYLLHVPAGVSAAKPVPLMLALHGRNMTAKLLAYVTKFNVWSDKTGFIVVYPQGIDQMWDTGRAPAIDDVRFMKELLAKLENTYSIDVGRVTVVGFSNGAEFAQELACSDDFHFNAVVAQSATLHTDAAKRCAPKHTVRLVELHGTVDPVVPYDGGHVPLPGSSTVISVADDLKLWQQINHCASDAKTDRMPDNGDDGTHIERVTFHGCAAGGSVTHYRMVGAGHVWPGYLETPKELGKTTMQMDASQYVTRIVSGEIEP